MNRYRRYVVGLILAIVLLPIRQSASAFSGSSGTPGANSLEGVRISKLYHIGAYYFGYWGPDFPKDQLNHYKAVFGHESDWWAGVRDLYEPDVAGTPKLYPGQFAHLKPAIGYYDLSNPATIEKHITQAVSFGLDYFNFYFYWNKNDKQEKYADGLNSFLRARNRNDIHFMVSITADPSNSSIPIDQFDQVAEHLVQKYLSLPNYLRAPDKKFAIEILDNRGIGDGSAADTDLFVLKLRQATSKLLRSELFLLAAVNNSNYNEWRSADGYTCSDHFFYPEGSRVLRKPYESYINNIDAYFQTVRGNFLRPLPFLSCAISGHDERPRVYLNTHANTRNEIQSIRSRLPYYTDRSPELFREALIRTKMDMDAAAGPLKTFLCIYAWNEWNEGGIIEPNVQDGSAYLKAVADVFNAGPTATTSKHTIKNYPSH